MLVIYESCKAFLSFTENRLMSFANVNDLVSK